MKEDEVKFGDYRFDLGRRELTKGGQPIRLGSRALEILCVLASARGNVVTKDELLARVWPGVVVEENALHVHISGLRKTLDAGEPSPGFIVTAQGRGYRLAGVRAAPSVAEELDQPAGLALPDRPSIAVLPFYNMSDDVEQEYFADGIVEDIITGLSRIEWLFVIARNSSFVFKGRANDVKQVGRDLGVRYVLEGSVRRAGNRVRITAQLIEAQTGVHIWTERYDRLFDDIFAVQDEITMSVVGAIEPSLRRLEMERVRRDRPDSLDAYDLVLRALPFAHKFMVDGADAAIPLLRKAVELEPDYSGAHALLARCFHVRFSRGGLHEEDRAASIRHARAAIGSDDATALAIAGLVIWFDEHDVATAFDLFDRALAISNSNVIALGNSAFALAWMGQAELAIERALRALRHSPLDALNSYLALSVAHFHAGRYGEARNAARRAAESKPNFSVPQLLLASALQRLGRDDEARAAAQQARVLDSSFTIRRFSVTVGLVSTVFAAFADAWREAGLPDE
jgi:TolB-like protein/tetratricopeptide (TPR) repeat protein